MRPLTSRFELGEPNEGIYGCAEFFKYILPQAAKACLFAPPSLLLFETAAFFLFFLLFTSSIDARCYHLIFIVLPLVASNLSPALYFSCLPCNIGLRMHMYIGDFLRQSHGLS